MNTIEESGETLIASESSSTSDHVVLSSSTIEEAQSHEIQQLMMGQEGGPQQQQHHHHQQPLMDIMGQRPSLIVRQWISDVKRRASQIVNAPPDSPDRRASAAADDEYFLVPDSSGQSEILDENESLDVSMRVDIHSDPMVELMLENRISKLETDLHACEIEYEQRIQTLEKELLAQALAHEKQKSSLQSHIKDLEGHLASQQHESSRVHELEEQVATMQQEKESQRTTLQLEGDTRVKELEAQLASFQQENISLREAAEQQKQTPCQLLAQMKASAVNEEQNEARLDEVGATKVEKLSVDNIVRYSRQLLLQDGFGVEGQLKLLSSSVLVVGAGGIGSTVLMYLAASGIGHISVIDFDEVDRSNLHRQVIHADANVGLNKAVSACQAVNALNPTIRCTPIQEALTFKNAYDIVSRHDCIVDASDNPRTRYLINDACVLAKKPLVSGSAMGTEGQLSVYNHENGSCYRCLYPKPNASEGCKSCSDNGVLGPVPGLIGVLQSLEVLKLLTGIGKPMHDRLLMYDSLSCSFVNIKKPPKSGKCPVCSENSTIQSMDDSDEISRTARGPSGVAEDGKPVAVYSPPELPDDLAISCSEYDAVRKRGDPHVLVDVRAKRQFDMCSLDGAINIPWADLAEDLDRLEELSDGTKPVYCLCRRGVLSVLATETIAKAAEDRPRICSVKNISGGLAAWTEEVDPSFPKY